MQREGVEQVLVVNGCVPVAALRKVLDRAELAEAELAALIHDIERAKEQHMHLLAERDAAFAAGQDAERERCWTLAMDAYEVWWRRSVATAYDPLQKLADKIGRPIKDSPT